MQASFKKKNKKKISKILTLSISLLAAISLAACSTGGSPSESSSADEVSSELSSPASSATDSSSLVDETNSSPIRVAALKGPTAMGMVEMMEDNDGYEFSIYASPDEVTPKIVQGQVDIAAIPANLASVLFNKTEGNITVLNINTLGVLYIVENGGTVQSVADLKGKTIFASGKGATPEYALNYMLEQNGINPETDVNIEYKAEHTECVSALTTTENSVAMLPQPFVTTAQQKNENIKIVLDLNKEWEAVSGNTALVTGVTVVRTDFLREQPQAVESFIQEHKASSDYVNANVAQASELMEKYDIIPAAVAEKAIPLCNISSITGDEMKTKLSSYIGVLMEQNPQSIGGSLPDDSFYFISED